MAEYITAPVPEDPDELKAIVFDYLRAKIPGWEVSDANLDAWIVEAFAEVVAEVHETVGGVLDSIFRYYGEHIANIPPLNATEAQGTATFTAINASGPYPIPAGTALAFGPAGAKVAFETSLDAVIPNGATTVNVAIVASEAGAAGSGLTGTGTIVDPYDYLSSVALTGPTTGGRDEEPDETYLDRLADELSILAPTPILAPDFVVLARRVNGVSRALAIDNYIPAGPGGTPAAQTNAERACYVILRDEAGEPVTSGTKLAVGALFDESKMLNFVVAVGDPTYTTVNVAYAGTVWPGWSPADVKLAVDAALANYVGPRDWGQPTFGETREWIDDTKVRYLEVAQVINSVEGFRHITSLTLNGSAADVTLTGPGALPRLGTLTGTVTS